MGKPRTVLESTWGGEVAPVRQVRTEFSTTIFSGGAEEWDRYLQLPSERRYDHDRSIRIHPQSGKVRLAFEPLGDEAIALAHALTEGFSRLGEMLEERDHVRPVLKGLVSAAHDEAHPVFVCLSTHLPSLGTSERVSRGEDGAPLRVVLQTSFVESTLESLSQVGEAAGDGRLGICWPLLARVISALSYPMRPRDRFLSKIDVFARLAFLELNVLYRRTSGGRLECTVVGDAVEEMVSGLTSISRKELAVRHPYFRMLSRVSFALRPRPFADYADELKIAAREYLDARYLRLSLAGAMPDLSPTMAAMSYVRKRDRLKTPEPLVGHYGILDNDDLDAWKQVDGCFRELGYSIVRQLGMGQFGRVYEAVTASQGLGPERVALKVDRILGKKKRAILEAEMAMEVGRGLAAAPHLMRLYDTGKLPGRRYTYHVLQLIDGDTLDTLLGASGMEHLSVSRPNTRVESEAESRRIHAEALRRGADDLAARTPGRPFRFPLSPAMMLDLLTSVLFCVEEAHALGYAINDLKNDNLMMSRRGQIKGIDLDSYSPICSDLDKYTDFLFLSSSLLFVLSSVPTVRLRRPGEWEHLADSDELLRRELKRAWPSGLVEKLSDGRVSQTELLDILVHLVRRSRSLAYARDTELFSADISALISLKHRLLIEDLVVD